MNGLINLRLEQKKLKRRWMSLLFLSVFLLIGLWCLWSLSNLDLTSLNDPSAMLYLNLLLMNTILFPITAAALACRMCDMEQAGNTYKWLCTMEDAKEIYQGKAALGALWILFFFLGEFLLYQLLLQSLAESFSLTAGLSLFFTSFMTGLCIFFLQLNLSMTCVNQLTPIFINIAGSFAGLFSWFLPQFPLRYFTPWGYFAALCSTGYIYDQEARYTTYFWRNYPVFWLIFLTAFTFSLYWYGKKRFLTILQETI